MTDITIPPEAVEAALPFVAMCQSYCKPTAHDCQCRQNTFFALRAGIAAWPGMIGHGDIVPSKNGPPLHIRNAIILPTENANAEA